MLLYLLKYQVPFEFTGMFSLLPESYSILQNSLFYGIRKVDIGILSSVSLCCIICTDIYWNIYFSAYTMATGRGIYWNVLSFATWLLPSFTEICFTLPVLQKNSFQCILHHGFLF